MLLILHARYFFNDAYIKILNLKSKSKTIKPVLCLIL